MSFLIGDQNDARTLFAVPAVMPDPGFAEDLPAEAAVPHCVHPAVAGELASGLGREGVGRGAQTDDRTATFDVVDEVPHLVLFRNKALNPKLTKLYWLVAIWTLGFPLIANSWGWIFTEMGRQPWVVYGVLRTRDAVSPGVSQGEVLTSMLVFTLLYAVLAVVEIKLLLKYAKAGPPELTDSDRNPPTKIGGDSTDADRPMAFSY